MANDENYSHQAVLILAHNHMDQVLKLAEYLLTTFNVYIHIDKKTQLTRTQSTKMQQMLTDYSGNTTSKNIFKVVSIYDVKWGSYSIVRATIDLMKLAYRDQINDQFHLISGQDWPLKPLNKIYDFYDGNDITYMDYYLTTEKVKSHEPEIWWVKYYFNYDQVNRRTLFGKIYHRVLLLIQTIFRVNKLKNTKWNEQQMYAGKEWIDIPREALGVALDQYGSDKELQHIFATSFCSDEMWLQTVLCNNKNYHGKVDKNIHRFITEVTKNGHGATPDILTEKYYDEIVNGDAFWGRKFVSPDSDKLLKLLQKHNN